MSNTARTQDDVRNDFLAGWTAWVRMGMLEGPRGGAYEAGYRAAKDANTVECCDAFEAYETYVAAEVK